jgi:alkylation response protein AidB-like acyl-CoA dehydrogenase
VELVDTKEQELLRATARELLERHSPVSAARERAESGGPYDADAWRLLVQELGVLALHVPEDAGGLGFGYAELGIVLEEMGRVLYPGPFLATAGLAIPLLLSAGATDLLAGVVGGSLTATVAVPGPAVELRERRLSGVLPAVLSGGDCDLLLVAAGESATFYAVRADGDGVEVDRGSTLDPARPIVRVTLTEVAADSVGDGEILILALPAMRACFAAELLGVAERSLESVVEYVGQRRQFGVPVGSFQAVQHQCANLLLAVEEARSAVRYALWAATAGADDLDTAGDIALAVSLTAAAQVTRSAIQLYGGIGFTWEHDAHLFFRRAAAAPAVLGSVGELRRAVAARAFERAAIPS